jgi:hypothetical protein
MLAETMQELQRMHQLNLELLEQLDVACSFLLQNQVKIPNKSTFKSLLRKAWALMDEIRADEINIHTVSRRKVTDFGTDEDETEPFSLPFLNCWLEWSRIKDFLCTLIICVCFYLFVFC